MKVLWTVSCGSLVALLWAVSAPAGNTYRPLTTDSPSVTTARPVKKISDKPWFPDSLPVVVSNKTVSYVTKAQSYKINPSWSPLIKLSIGTVFPIYDPNYREVKFQVSSVNTNMVTLQIQGTLTQKKIPLDIMENQTK